MLKKIFSSLFAFLNVGDSDNKNSVKTSDKNGHLKTNSDNLKYVKNHEAIDSSIEKVDEYFFKVINYKKINYELETDPGILSSYEDYDDGDYPLHLNEYFLPNLCFYSTTNYVKVKFEIFLSLDITLRRKSFFNNTDILQEYFIKKYNTCFFYDKEMVNKTNDYAKLATKINIDDFQNIVLPNIIPDLLSKVDTDTNKTIYYNWDFFRSNGNYAKIGVNLLYTLIDHVPYHSNILKVIETEKLQFYAYANIRELASFTHGIEFEGLERNAEHFDETYQNDFFEQVKEEIYTNKITYRYIIKPKSGHAFNELKNEASKIKSNLEILNKWFFDEKQIRPFKIR